MYIAVQDLSALLRVYWYLSLPTEVPPPHALATNTIREVFLLWYTLPSQKPNAVEQDLCGKMLAV